MEFEIKLLTKNKDDGLGEQDAEEDIFFFQTGVKQDCLFRLHFFHEVYE
jgi:hypothetical protein